MAHGGPARQAGWSAQGTGRGAIPRPSRLIHELALVEPLLVLAHLVAGHVVLRDRGRAAVRRGRRTGAACVHATGDTTVLIERRSLRRGGTAGLGRGALTQAGLRGLPGPLGVRCRARNPWDREDTDQERGEEPSLDDPGHGCLLPFGPFGPVISHTARRYGVFSDPCGEDVTTESSFSATSSCDGADRRRRDSP